VRCLALNPREMERENLDDEARVLFSGSGDRSIKIWNTRTGLCLRTLFEHTSTVMCLIFAPVTNELVTGSCDKTIKIFKSDTYECVKTLKGHASYVLSLIILEMK
jgi:WD40 repeat protein